MIKGKKEKLNIAVMGSVTLPIPPFNGYGGTQRGVYDFLTHMNEKGHRLHLFGPEDSEVSDLKNVVLHSFVKKSLWIPENKLSAEVKREHSQEHYKRSLEVLDEVNKQEGIDIINIRKDNLGFIQDIVDTFGPERVVYSLHNVKDQARIDIIKNLEILCIAHCRNHREQHGNLQNIKTITYGINVSLYPFLENNLTESNDILTLDILKRLKEGGENYLLSLGGIGSHKGQRTCIELAKETKIPLIIAGTPQDRTQNKNQRYFDEEIKHHIDGKNIIYFGNANEEEKKDLLKFSKGFLFPSGYEDKAWNEPFGRTTVEALACGTPVIAYRKGSMEEVIFDGFNGYLFDSSEEAVRQIKSLDYIERKNCRETAEKKFDSKRVSDEYESLFYKILNTS
tara:strand:- start:894 stop:2078 length:1185 start_codon:yes stop_codon:yes gene_type:complete